MSSMGSETLLYHPTDKAKFTRVSYAVGATGINVVYDVYENHKRVREVKRFIDVHPKSLNLQEYVRDDVSSWAANNGYVLEKPDYPDTIPWRIDQHLGNELVVVYAVNGVPIKTKIVIPGADDKITEDIVRTAIENEVKAAARKRRFWGLEGNVIIPNVTGGDKDGSSTGDKTP